MNKHLLKHIEILKTVPEIKESIEELEFGCILEISGNYYTFTKMDGKNFYTLESNLITLIPKYTKIIGQVHEGQLRMFLEKKSNCLYELPVELDNTKPYMEQSPEFFEKLNKWLIEEFNINL